MNLCYAVCPCQTVEVSTDETQETADARILSIKQLLDNLHGSFNIYRRKWTANVLGWDQFKKICPFPSASFQQFVIVLKTSPEPTSKAAELLNFLYSYRETLQHEPI